MLRDDPGRGLLRSVECRPRLRVRFSVSLTAAAIRAVSAAIVVSSAAVSSRTPLLRIHAAAPPPSRLSVRQTRRPGTRAASYLWPPWPLQPQLRGPAALLGQRQLRSGVADLDRAASSSVDNCCRRLRNAPAASVPSAGDSSGQRIDRDPPRASRARSDWPWPCPEPPPHQRAPPPAPATTRLQPAWPRCRRRGLAPLPPAPPTRRAL